MKRIFSAFCGVLCGFINGTVGAGGGLVAVPMLQKSGLSQKKSHSTAVAVLLPVCIVSAISYVLAGNVTPSDAAPFFLPSSIGAVLGTLLLGKIKTNHLKKVFAIFMIYAGVRLFLK